MTIVTIKTEKPSSLPEKIAFWLHPFRLETEIRQAEDIRLRIIRYIQRHPPVRLDLIEKQMNAEEPVILCEKGLSLKDSSLKRFEGLKLNTCLLKNFVQEVLKELGEYSRELTISFYDPMAEHADFAGELLAYTSNVKVITEQPRYYENESDKLLEEKGTSFIVSNSCSRIAPCDLLVAPVRIKRPLPTAPATPVFTISKPLVSTPGWVLTRYYPDFPEKWKKLLPLEMDLLYVLSGLYELYDREEAAQWIPKVCATEGERYSIETVRKRLLSAADAKRTK